MVSQCRHLILLGIIALAYRAETLAQGSIQLALGNPSHARDDGKDRNNFLIAKKQFALSYNNAKGTPNWVSWRIVRSDMGDAPRGDFEPEMSLPRGFTRVFSRDYSNSGFDRGHMCPHADRAHTADDSAATFTMTNIIPQSPHVNQFPWNDLEIYCRDLVRREGKRVYVVSGPFGIGGTGRKGFRKTLADGKVTVPAQCWKVIMAIDPGQEDDLSRINARTRTIAVIMPNDEKVDMQWSRYRTSIAEVEKLTGYVFFDKVPAAVIGPLKEKVDKTPIRYIPRR